MTDVEPPTSEDVFVAEVLPDIAWREVVEPRRPALAPDREARLSGGAARPLTSAEREAAHNDPGIPPRVCAPASLRVPKRPLPADERFFRPEEVAIHRRAPQRANTVALTSPATETVTTWCELVQTPA